MPQRSPPVADDGPPGIRPHDRVKYYAAFIVDLDGNRIEAVTFPRNVEAS